MIAVLATELLSAQMGMIDVQAMVWAFAAAWTPPNPHLSLVRPNLKLCSKRIMVPIIEVIVLSVVTQTACFALLRSTDWYRSESGSAASIQVNLWLWLSILANSGHMSHIVSRVLIIPFLISAADA